MTNALPLLVLPAGAVVEMLVTGEKAAVPFDLCWPRAMAKTIPYAIGRPRISRGPMDLEPGRRQQRKAHLLQSNRAGRNGLRKIQVHDVRHRRVEPRGRHDVAGSSSRAAIGHARTARSRTSRLKRIVDGRFRE